MLTDSAWPEIVRRGGSRRARGLARPPRFRRNRCPDRPISAPTSITGRHALSPDDGPQPFNGPTSRNIIWDTWKTVPMRSREANVPNRAGYIHQTDDGNDPRTIASPTIANSRALENVTASARKFRLLKRRPNSSPLAFPQGNNAQTPAWTAGQTKQHDHDRDQTGSSLHLRENK